MLLRGYGLVGSEVGEGNGDLGEREADVGCFYSSGIRRAGARKRAADRPAGRGERRALFPPRIECSVGRELEIGWLPPLMQQSRNGKIQPGAPGYASDAEHH